MNITKTFELPLIGISHNPDIKKQVFIQKGTIPQLMMFGRAFFEPNQAVEEHLHETMYEVFYITSGKAIFSVNGKEHEVTVGDCVTINPGEPHAQKNPFPERVEWLYFGIAIS